MIDVMIDLETLGTGPDAAIVSIGAVEFDWEGLHKEFYAAVKPQSCIDLGMSVTAATVAWWGEQDWAARKALADPNAVHIAHALENFAYFLVELQLGGVHPKSDIRIWGNGATFDNVILGNAFKTCGLEVPWDFRGDRCYRTMVDGLPKRKQVGTHHNALDDARSQAEHLIKVAAYRVWPE